MVDPIYKFYEEIFMITNLLSSSKPVFFKCNGTLYIYKQYQLQLELLFKVITLSVTIYTIKFAI